MKRKHPPVLALHATSKGFGFVVMSGPFSLVDWGTRQATTNKNAVSLKALTRLLDRFDPHTVVLEDPAQLTRRSARITRLYHAIAALCHGRSIDLAVVSRKDIYHCYATVGALTWQEIAEAVAHQLEPLRTLVPRRRRPWQGETRRMAIFSAAAVAMTHWQLSDASHSLD